MLRIVTLMLVTGLFVRAVWRRRSNTNNALRDMFISFFAAPERPLRHLALGLAAGSAVAIPLAIAGALGWARMSPVPLDGHVLPAVGTAMTICVWAALEELIFRGALLTEIRKGTSLLAAVVLSSTLFALAHVGGRRGFEDARSIAIWTLDGVAYCCAFIGSGSLWLPTAWHASKNLWVWLVFDLSSFKIAPGLMHVEYVGPELLSGSRTQAGVLDLVVTAGVTAAAIYYVRGRGK